MLTPALTIADLSSPVTTAAEMRLWDEKAAADYGLSQNMLMENAGRAAWQFLREIRPCLQQEPETVLVLCGPGNNGGDGAVLARCLHDSGITVLVGHSKPLSRYSGAARFHVELARKAGVNFVYLRRGSASIPAAFQQPALLVDALLGTGFTGSLRPDLRELIAWVNQRRSFIYSLDIPSGLDAMTGQPSAPESLAVRADACVSFEAAKPGLLLPRARQWVGRLQVCSIGIPRQLREAYPGSFALLGPGRPERSARKIRDWLEPAPDLHKGRAGIVLVLGGSEGLTGAPHLSALAALRSGAGLVSVAAPAGLCGHIKGDMPDIMTIPLFKPGEGDDSHSCSKEWHPAMLGSLLPRLLALRGRRYPPVSLVLGPGLGRGSGAGDFMAALFSVPISEEDRPPLLLDADALYHLGNKVISWDQLTEKDLLTPHPGEAAQLLGCGVAEVERDRVGALKALCAKGRAAVLLKGAGTLIAQGANLKAAEPENAACESRGSGSGNGLAVSVGSIGEPGGLLSESSGKTLSPVLISPYAEPNLAVGGSGDVLSGICGFLLARGLPSLETAALAVQIHARCGEILRGGFPLRGNLASDIARAIPEALEAVSN